MFPFRSLLAIALLVTAGTTGASAQQSSKRSASQAELDPSERHAARVDPAVVRVITRGRWQTQGRSGSYRVVEVSEGWETVRYRVFVQWLEETDDGTRVKVWREVGALVPDQFSLVNPDLSFENGRWELSVEAASAPMEQPSQTLKFVLGGPGIIKGSAAR